MVGGADVDDCTIRVSPLPGSNMPTQEWVVDADCPEAHVADWVEIRMGSDVGRVLDKTILSGAYENEYTWAAGTTVTQCDHDPRKCGGVDDVPARTYSYRVEIIKLNGVDY
jgi:hypothetical protein